MIFATWQDNSSVNFQIGEGGGRRVFVLHMYAYLPVYVLRCACKRVQVLFSSGEKN
jgi:hypothetical protein